MASVAKALYTVAEVAEIAITTQNTNKNINLYSEILHKTLEHLKYPKFLCMEGPHHYWKYSKFKYLSHLFLTDSFV